MIAVKLKYLIEDVDRYGNLRYYVRRPGLKKIPIKGIPGTDAFLDAYKAAMADQGEKAVPKAQRAAGADPASLRGLFEMYYRSAEYKSLGPSTRHVRRLILDRIAQRDGDKPYRLLETRHIRSDRDKLFDRPEAANSEVKALRQVFKWAVEAEHAVHNPAQAVPYLKANNPDGIHTWTIQEVEQFEAKYAIGTKPRLALALLLYTGVRRSDVVKLGRQMARNGWLHFVETKGAAQQIKDRDILILPQLQAVIDATPAGHLTYLVTEHGKPYSPEGFSNWFRRKCRDAGLAKCSAHGLRKAGATIAADNGATEHQLMAIFGWESPKQAAHYTRKANRKKLAGQGMQFISIEEQNATGKVQQQSDNVAKLDKSARKAK